MLFPPLSLTNKRTAAVLAKENFSINVEATLAKPRHRSLYFSICMLTKHTEPEKDTTGCCADDSLYRAGKMQVDLERGIAMLYLKNGPKSPELNHDLGRECLQIREPFPLSNCTGQGLGGCKYILPGIYRITRHKNSYVLRLRLVKRADLEYSKVKKCN